MVSVARHRQRDSVRGSNSRTCSGHTSQNPRYESLDSGMITPGRRREITSTPAKRTRCGASDLGGTPLAVTSGEFRRRYRSF